MSHAPRLILPDDPSNTKLILSSNIYLWTWVGRVQSSSRAHRSCLLLQIIGLDPDDKNAPLERTRVITFIFSPFLRDVVWFRRLALGYT